MKKFIAFVLLAICAAGCNNHDSDDSDCPTCHNGHCHRTSTNVSTTTTIEVPATFPAPVPPAAPVVAAPAAAPDTTIAIGTGIKRAVIVGINVYSDPGAPTLAGCVDDALDIKTKAISAWGFKDECITMLLDKQATKAAVVKALTDAVAATQPGDTLLYWQSSHGAEDAVSDDANGEPDHMNQMVCCTDFSWDPKFELIDKDFVAIFSRLPADAIFNWGSDSCHSGDLDKQIKKHNAKGHFVVRKEFPQTVAVAARVAKAKARSLPMRKVQTGILNVGFISGCQSDQTSADTQDENGRPCGALTHYFLANIDALADASLVDVAAKVDSALSADGYDQVPVAEGGRKNKPWLK